MSETGRFDHLNMRTSIREFVIRISGANACGFIASPPSCRWGRLRPHLHSQPGGADGHGVAGLLRAVEELLDVPLVFGASPGGEQAADGVDGKDLLERQGDLRSNHRAERKIENWVASHTTTHSLRADPGSLRGLNRAHGFPPNHRPQI